LESIHEVHPPSQKRSSARLRPMRGSSALMVVDDDVFEELTSRAMGGPGANAGGEVEGPAARVGEVAMRTQGENNDGPNIPTRKLSPIAELQPPSPAVLRPRSNTTAGLQPQRSSAESALSARRSLRSLVSTPTATVTRPWNFDEYYPWATTTHPSVNITLPPPSATRNSPRAGPSHLRNALSDATTSTFTSARTTTASPTGNATGLKRQSHRLSIFGSSSDQAHAVGERYPTSALSPPTAIFRDNLSTCDTSDDEDFTTSRKTRLSLRKRFSSAARNNTLILTPPRVTRSKTNPADLASPASDNENSSATLQDRFGEARAFTNSHRHTYRDAQGMPTSTYRRQRLVESIKRWYHKGAELIRTFSRRN
jgi:serine/arginine repetitive matrix protein 2